MFCFFFHSISDKIRIILLYIIFKNGKNIVSQGAFHSNNNSGLNFQNFAVVNETTVSGISGSSDNLARHTHIFDNVIILGNFLPLNFPLRISGVARIDSHFKNFQEISVAFAPFKTFESSGIFFFSVSGQAIFVIMAISFLRFALAIAVNNSPKCFTIVHVRSIIILTWLQVFRYATPPNTTINVLPTSRQYNVAMPSQNRISFKEFLKSLVSLPLYLRLLWS